MKIAPENPRSQPIRIALSLFFTFVLFSIPVSAHPYLSDDPYYGRWSIYEDPFESGPGPIWFDHFRERGDLTVDEARAGLERWLASIGNPRLKLGNVAEKDSQTITADIVTVDNSLVEKFDIDRHTGIIWQLQERGYFGPHRFGARGEMEWDHGFHGRFYFPFAGFFFFLLLLVFFTLIFFPFYRHRHEAHDRHSLESLNIRYASGMMGREEYLRRKGKL